jgi:hypothetical protein
LKSTAYAVIVELTASDGARTAVMFNDGTAKKTEAWNSSVFRKETANYQGTSSSRINERISQPAAASLRGDRMDRRCK